MALARTTAMKASGAMKTKKTAMKAKAMKAMKAKAMKKAMKAKVMKKAMKAMKKSMVAKGKLAKAMVLRGSKTRTSGGLKKENLKKNKAGEGHGVEGLEDEDFGRLEEG